VKLRSIAAAALTLAATACVDNNASLQWVAICAPPDDATDCVFAETCDAQYIGEVALDTSVSNFLWLFVEYANNRFRTDDPDQGQLNTADAYIQGYDVEFEGIGLSVPASAHDVPSYWVPAEGTAVVSVFVPVTATAPAGGVYVTALIRTRGVYGDGASFETAAIEVPIFMCAGCLGIPTCPPATPTLVATCPPTFGQLPLSGACE
jgi:hypothetical protein